MKILFFLLCISFSSFAKKAVIRVLEAPLFKKEKESSFVIQYRRKGSEVYIHNDLAPTSLFYKTLTTTGDTAYILKKHVYVYHRDTQELTQEKLSFDDTDYRIEEPLPSEYPLHQVTGYRGQIYFSLGVPNKESYPYSTNSTDVGYSFNKTLGFVWQREVKYFKSKRFFHGASMQLSNFSQEFIFNGSNSIEKHNLFSVGPYLSYDAFKMNRSTINLHGSLNINLVDKLELTQNGETANYSSFNLSSSLGATYQYTKLLGTLDFIAGFNIDLIPPKTYKQADSSSFKTSFKSAFTTQISYLFGIQSSY